MDSEKGYLTTIEVADVVGVHQTTIIRWMEDGKLEGYRTPGGHRRFDPQVLRSFLEVHDLPGLERLEALDRAPAARLSVEKPSAEIPRVQVLIVGEPQIVRTFLRYFAKSKLLEARGTSSGAKALITMARKSPQVLVLDLDLPALDGISVIEALREDAELAEVAVVVLSGKVTRKARKRFESLGVDSILEKPAAPRSVQDAILGEVLPKLLRSFVAT